MLKKPTNLSIKLPTPDSFESGVFFMHKLMNNPNTRKFVLHHHTHQQNPAHFDLMLESLDGKTLETFRLATQLCKLRSGETISLEKIAGHDIKFLTYQGAVNHGCGNVELVEKGDFEQNQIDSSKAALTFHTAKAVATYNLTHISGNKYSLTKLDTNNHNSQE